MTPKLCTRHSFIHDLEGGQMSNEPLSSKSKLTLSQTAKFFDLSKFKAFADDNREVSKRLIFVLGRVENIMGNGENDGYQHFLLLPLYFTRGVKTRDCLGKG